MENPANTSKEANTSPSPAHFSEALADNGYALGYGSPTFKNGNTSPGQGRSIREYEEQLRSLQKENFNLKLRIYILEEKNPGGGTPHCDGTESLHKQNVDLKVEIESLRKELQEKQSVLIQAAKALEMVESNQKDLAMKHQDQIEELNQRNQLLQLEIKAIERGDTQSTFSELMEKSEIDSNANQKIVELEAMMKKMEEKNLEMSNKLSSCETTVKDREDKISELQAVLDSTRAENMALLEQLDEKDVAVQDVERSKQYLIESSDKIHELTSENTWLKSYMENVKNQMEQERLLMNNKQQIIVDQYRLLQEQNKSMLTKEKHLDRMKVGIRAYESYISELMKQRTNIIAENQKLKNLFLKNTESLMKSSKDQFMGRMNSNDENHKCNNYVNSTMPSLGSSGLVNTSELVSLEARFGSDKHKQLNVNDLMRSDQIMSTLFKQRSHSIENCNANKVTIAEVNSKSTIRLPHTEVMVNSSTSNTLCRVEDRINLNEVREVKQNSDDSSAGTTKLIESVLLACVDSEMYLKNQLVLKPKDGSLTIRSKRPSDSSFKMNPLFEAGNSLRNVNLNAILSAKLKQTRVSLHNNPMKVQCMKNKNIEADNSGNRIRFIYESTRKN